MALIVSIPPAEVASAQDTLVPEQDPERKLTTASSVEEPVTFIVGFVVVATNLYHTSSSDVPEQPVADEFVAPTVVPDVVEQDEFCVRVIAEVQASLAGPAAAAPYTQMVNVPAVEAVDPKLYTRT